MRLLLRLLAAYGLASVIVLYTPITEWLALPLLVEASPPSSADAIIVMEAWASAAGELNEAGLKRALRASELYRAGVSEIVVITGLATSGGREGSAIEPMAALLRLSGVPPRALVLEDRSVNTRESAVHVAELARNRHWTQVVLVTDALHMSRAAGSFRAEGLDVLPAPVLGWNFGAELAPLRLARLGTLTHEYGGLLYYWWREWI